MAHYNPLLVSHPQRRRNLSFWGPIGALGLGLVLLVFFFSAILRQFEAPSAAANVPASCSQYFAGSAPSVHGSVL